MLCGVLVVMRAVCAVCAVFGVCVVRVCAMCACACVCVRVMCVVCRVMCVVWCAVCDASCMVCGLWAAFVARCLLYVPCCAPRFERMQSLDSPEVCQTGLQADAAALSPSRGHSEMTAAMSGTGKGTSAKCLAVNMFTMRNNS